MPPAQRNGEIVFSHHCFVQYGCDGKGERDETQEEVSKVSQAWKWQMVRMMAEGCLPRTLLEMNLLVTHPRKKKKQDKSHGRGNRNWQL